MKPIWLFLMSVVSASMGQVLFKKGVLMTGEVTIKTSILGELIKLVFNPVVFSGLALYIVSTVLWLIALSKTTLNFAYPFTALTFVLVAGKRDVGSKTTCQFNPKGVISLSIFIRTKRSFYKFLGPTSPFPGNLIA